MLTIAIANLKGGVGKSTTTVCLAEALALHHRKRVLILDLDPQANTSFMLLSRQGVDQADFAGRTLTNFLLDQGRNTISDYVRAGATDVNEILANKNCAVDILPSIPRVWFVEKTLQEAAYKSGNDPAKQLVKMFTPHLAALREHYHLCLIDCPPGFSSLTRAGVMLANAIISPTIADPVSTRSLADFVRLGLPMLEADTKPHYVVITKYQPRNTTEPIRDLLRSTYNVLEPSIRYSTHMLEATERIRNDSFRTFRNKYSSLEADVIALAGDAERKILRPFQSVPTKR